MARNTYVRIGEAARLAGVSIDTLRRWEREGRLSATRTFGGQRTYSLAEIEALRDNRESNDADEEAPEEAVEAPREPAATATVHPWKARTANAAADLSVTRLKIERREELRRYREEDERRIEAQRAEAEARVAESRLAAQREKERERQQQALDSCIHSIRIRLLGEPSDVRAEVERFIAEHAIPGEPVECIKAEVEAILDRRRAERDAAREQQLAEDRRRSDELSRKAREDFSRTLLILHGERLARTLTASRDEWDADIAEEALEEVREHLTEVVLPAWTERRVEREVREILAEWEDD